MCEFTHMHHHWGVQGWGGGEVYFDNRGRTLKTPSRKTRISSKEVHSFERKR